MLDTFYGTVNIFSFLYILHYYWILNKQLLCNMHYYSMIVLQCHYNYLNGTVTQLKWLKDVYKS